MSTFLSARVFSLTENLIENYVAMVEEGAAATPSLLAEALTSLMGGGEIIEVPFFYLYGRLLLERPARLLVVLAAISGVRSLKDLIREREGTTIFALHGGLWVDTNLVASELEPGIAGIGLVLVAALPLWAAFVGSRLSSSALSRLAAAAGDGALMAAEGGSWFMLGSPAGLLDAGLSRAMVGAAARIAAGAVLLSQCISAGNSLLRNPNGSEDSGPGSGMELGQGFVEIGPDAADAGVESGLEGPAFGGFASHDIT